MASQPAPRPVVVGVGVAPGGLDALRQLLAGVPAGAGLAVIVIADGLAAADLGATTPLAVVAAEDGVEVWADVVYVCPGPVLASVENGHLRLAPPDPRPGRADDAGTAVDHLLRALAKEPGGRAVAVVLAGAGGEVGLRAVADAGGLTLAQHPAGRGVAADHTLPVAAMAAELVAHARHLNRPAGPDALASDVTDALPEVCELLAAATGHQFKHYKPNTLVRRITRRLRVVRAPSAAAYLARLRADPAEAAALFQELLINVTAFFRDPEAFAALATDVLPGLFAGRDPGDPVRAWVCGCATGEEAYTLAILLAEEAGRHPGAVAAQLFATDLDDQALAVARRGAYPAAAAAEIPSAYLDKYFAPAGRQYVVGPALREAVLFSAHNLINDPPFSRVDLISCRNVLIYLGPHLQQKLIPVFHYALRPGGYLFLGPSENLSSHQELFKPVDGPHRISQRLPTAIRPAGPPPSGRAAAVRPPNAPDAPPTPDADTYQVMQRITLDEFAPKALVVTAAGRIVCASGNLEKYLSVSAGVFQNSLPRLAKDELAGGVRAALAEAVEYRRQVVHDGMSLAVPGGVQRVAVTVQPMPQLGDPAGLYYVVFQDIGRPTPPGQAGGDLPPADSAAALTRVERELARTRVDLEQTVQNFEAANQELKASNEDLLSMNEELQAANEELQTSKEEVQAVNDALGRANTDLENLLASTRIGTVFLDKLGLVRRVTATQGVYNVRPADTGRPLTDFTSRAPDMPPLPDFAAVVAAGSPLEAVVHVPDGPTLLRRVLPYLDATGAADGVVVTFTDITAQKTAEAELRDARDRLELALAAGAVGTWVWDFPVDRVYADANTAHFFAASPGVAAGGRAGEYLAAVHPADRDAVAAALDRAVFAGTDYRIEYRATGADGVERWLESRGRVDRDAAGGATRMAGVVADISARKAAAAALAASEDRVRLAVAAAGIGYWSWDFVTDQTDLDPVAAALLGVPPGATGAAVAAVIHPADRAAVDASLADAVAGRGQYRAEFRVPTPGGDYRWVAGLGDVIRDAAGLPARVAGVNFDVTARKLAAAELTDSERRFRSLVEATAAVVWRTDAAGQFVPGESSWAAFTGQSEADVVGWGWLTAVHPDDRAGVNAAWRTAVADRTPLAGEGRLRRHDGEYRHVEFRGVPVPDAAGGVREWVGTCTDVTAARAAAAVVRDSEAWFRALADTAPAALWVTDPAGQATFISRGWYELTGQPDGAGLGMGWADAVHPADRAAAGAAFYAANAKRGWFDRDYRVRRPDGEYRWALDRGRPRFGPGGEYLGMVGTVFDIDARKAAEAKLGARERELRALADNTPDVLVRFDRFLRPVFVNTAVERLTGKPAAAFAGWADPSWDVPGAVRAAWDSAVRAVFALGRGTAFEFDQDTPAGRRRFAARLVPELSPAGGPPEFAVGVVTDITAQKAAEAALIDADRRKDEFLATLAHELRNPLAPVRTGLQVLRMTPNPEVAARTRDMMDRQLGHMVRLIDDLLDVSRITRGQVELRPARVTLAAVVESALEVCRAQVEAAGHELVVDLPAGPVWLDADPTRLAQVVANLLTNAAKYTPDGGRVTVAGRADGADAVVSVTDTGVGIPADMLPVVFEMFAQVNRTLDRSQGGLGIGLTLVRRLVGLHGGTVTAASPGVGRGSTFTVRLPSAAGPADGDTGPPPAAAAGALRVLVVDDNVDGAESLAMLLELSGHTTRTAHTGPDGVAAAYEFCPDVVFLDIGLPGLSGYEVAVRLRDTPPAVRPVLAALTGYGSDADKAHAAAAGIDRHLTKPVDPAAVAALLRELSQSRGR